mgnify:CR=1 FL=1
MRPFNDTPVKPPLRTNSRTAPIYGVGEKWEDDRAARTILMIDGNEFPGYASNHPSVPFLHEVVWRNSAGRVVKGFSDDFRKWLLRARKVGG